MITKDRLIELANAKAEAQKAYAAAFKVAREAETPELKVDGDLNAKRWCRASVRADMDYDAALDEYMKQEASNG